MSWYCLDCAERVEPDDLDITVNVRKDDGGFGATVTHRGCGHDEGLVDMTDCANPECDNQVPNTEFNRNCTQCGENPRSLAKMADEISIIEQVGAIHSLATEPGVFT